MVRKRSLPLGERGCLANIVDTAVIPAGIAGIQNTGR